MNDALWLDLVAISCSPNHGFCSHRNHYSNYSFIKSTTTNESTHRKPQVVRFQWKHWFLGMPGWECGGSRVYTIHRGLEEGGWVNKDPTENGKHVNLVIYLTHSWANSSEYYKYFHLKSGTIFCSQIGPYLSSSQNKMNFEKTVTSSSKQRKSAHTICLNELSPAN